MKIRSILLGTAALAAVTLVPSRVSAQVTCGPATYSASLGLGGFLNGCFNFTLTEVGENAGGIANQFYWNLNNFTAPAGSGVNAPNTPGLGFFNDDCGSSGAVTGPGTTFAFCTDAAHGPTSPNATGGNLTGEFIMGLFITQDLVSNAGSPYWIYSGALSRNAFPAPPGFQAVLMQLTTGGTTANPGLGTPIDGKFLFAWEDLNTGCIVENIPHSFFRNEDLGSALALDDGSLHTCAGTTGPSISDSDYNDSYILLQITGKRLDTVTPEPMTMTLMATGLVGLAGASIRRRKKNQG